MMGSAADLCKAYRVRDAGHAQRVRSIAVSEREARQTFPASSRVQALELQRAEFAGRRTVRAIKGYGACSLDLEGAERNAIDNS